MNLRPLCCGDRDGRRDRTSRGNSKVVHEPELLLGSSSLCELAAFQLLVSAQAEKRLEARR